MCFVPSPTFITSHSSTTPSALGTRDCAKLEPIITFTWICRWLFVGMCSLYQLWYWLHVHYGPAWDDNCLDLSFENAASIALKEESIIRTFWLIDNMKPIAMQNLGVKWFSENLWVAQSHIGSYMRAYFGIVPSVGRFRHYSCNVCKLLCDYVIQSYRLKGPFPRITKKGNMIVSTLTIT